MSDIPRCLSQLVGAFRGSKESEVQQFLILGPEKSGKTTLLYRLKFGLEWTNMSQDLEEMRNPNNEEAFDTGFHYEEFSMLSNCGLWDVPAGLRDVWNAWYNTLVIHGIFFVVDAADLELITRKRESRRVEEANMRISKARKTLQALICEDDLRRACFTVVINSRLDKLAALRLQKEQVQETHPLFYRLGLHELHQSCAWRVKAFVVDCDKLDGEKAPAWQPILDHVKCVLKDARSYSLNFES